MLNHDDCVVEGSDSVCSAGTCETSLWIVIVTDAGGVHVSVRIDLSTADEGDDTIAVMQPVVCLKSDETDIWPLASAVCHETEVAYGTRNLDRGAVHKTGLND